MSTPDFDVAIERAVKAGMEAIYAQCRGYWPSEAEKTRLTIAARVVLEACGWEDAARITRDVAIAARFLRASSWPGEMAEEMEQRAARLDAWVAQYTPTSEGDDAHRT